MKQFLKHLNRTVNIVGRRAYAAAALSAWNHLLINPTDKTSMHSL